MRVSSALVLLVASCSKAAPPSHPPQVSPFNERVLALIDEYPEHGYGGYAWPAAPGTDGTTRDLRDGDTLIARGGTGNHCVGMTLEVFWRALAQCDGGVEAALDGEAALDLKRRWYVPELGGQGAVDALLHHGLGVPVELEHAQAGDFVQAWNGDETLGHSMIYLGMDGDSVRYWSSQPWTDGIGRAETALGADGFERTRVYVARASCPRP